MKNKKISKWVVGILLVSVLMLTYCILKYVPDWTVGKEAEELIEFRQFFISAFAVLSIWQARNIFKKGSVASFCRASDEDSQVALVGYFALFFVFVTYYKEFEITGSLDIILIGSIFSLLILPIIKIKNKK